MKARQRAPGEALNVVYLFIGMPVGGAEDFALGVYPHLSPDVNARFICLRELGMLGEESQLAGIPVELLPIFLTKRVNPLAIWRLSRWMKVQQIDIVHSQTYHAHLFGVAAARLAGIAAVVHQQKTLGKISIHKGIFFRWLLRNANKILTLSPQTSADIVKQFSIPISKIEVVPNAIDDISFCPPVDRSQIRKKLCLPENDFLIGTVASLHPVKNHKATIEALAILAKQGCRPKVLFIGDGPSGPELERLAREHGVLSQILFAGRQRPVVPWMQALDLFLLPSFWEGQALAMLQAISCELPVLASRIEGNTAILGSVHPGLFEPDDHGKLADLLQAAFQSGSVLSPLRSSVEVPTCRNAAEHLKQIYWDIAS